MTNISEKNYEIKNKKSQTIDHNEEISHDRNIKYKFEKKNNKINNANKIKILYKNPKKIKEKIFSNNTFKIQSKENKQKSPYKKNNPTKNIKTQSSKNNMVFSSSNIKNTHKIISRKKGISSSTKSLDIANHYIYNTQNNNSNCIKTIKKKKENFKKMEKRNVKEENIKSKKNIDINIQNGKNKINKIEKENTDINKTYSESDLGEVGGEIIDEESENDNLDEIDELNEANKVYYYDPKSIVNYSTVNFTNKKNRKYQSLSVSKEKLVNNIFNNSLNNMINKNLFKNDDLNKTQHINMPSQILENKHILLIKSMNDKINMRKNDIEKINKLISNIKKEIKNYDNEIRIIDNWIINEKKEGEILRQMINFVNMK